MKSLGAAFLTFLAVFPSAVVAVDDVPPPPAPSEPAAPPLPSLAQLVAQLSDESFQQREAASKELWQLGDSARETLQKAAAGNDPEAAHRAKALLHKIDLHLTPNTDPSIVALVERYNKAALGEKITLLKTMRQKHAYRQILTLYAAETDPKTRNDLQTVVSGIAVFAARERLVEGDAPGARELLELAPADAKSLMALAAFHRANGTLEQELQSAKTSKAKGALAWQLALQRAAGRLNEARSLASDAGEPLLAATMAMLAGDPLPWLEHHPANRRANRDTPDLYSPLATKRWQDHALRKSDLEPCLKMLSSRNQTLRNFASNSLFLLGEPTSAEPSYIKSSPFEAFVYFEALEHVPEALAAIGLDPENPDFSAWAQTRFDLLLKEPDSNEGTTSELTALAGFLENRGLNDELAKTFDAPLAELAKKNPDLFTNFLGSLFGSRFVRTGILGPLMGAGTTWAGDDAERWEQLVLAAFGDNEDNIACWKWFAEIQPDASRKQRLAAMLALAGYGADPDHLRDTWIAIAWAAITKADADQKAPLLKRLASLIGVAGDAATNLKIRDMRPPNEPVTELDGLALLQFSAAGRWEEASQLILQLLTSKTDLTANTRPDLHAYAASCLRRAGHPDQAATHDAWVEKLALGDAATYIRIGHGYAFGSEYDRCSSWWERAAREAAPDNESYTGILHVLSTDLLKRGLWSQAAATSEALAQCYSGFNLGSASLSSSSPLTFLRLRLQADQARALSLLATERPSALALLEKCHALLPCDGSLADYFFPALRQAGLIEQHDAWFAITWDHLQNVIQHYPLSHNTRNTTAWLAARALRRLDEAEAHLNQALANHPNQAAYLDTMAELQFARGNRKQAVEWSEKSVNFMPSDDDVRRQNFRFIHDPFPE